MWLRAFCTKIITLIQSTVTYLLCWRERETAKDQQNRDIVKSYTVLCLNIALGGELKRNAEGQHGYWTARNSAQVTNGLQEGGQIFVRFLGTRD